jgi:HlyD family secretion protein
VLENILVEMPGNLQGCISSDTVDMENTLVVPYEAVVEKDGQRIVFMVENGTAIERKVETGLDTELYTEIKSGLKEGETVIVNPGDFITDGARVSVLPCIPPGLFNSGTAGW